MNKKGNLKSTSVGSGYVHVYTGNGKGKTTAAIGLAVRAAGAGLNVYFAQFVKGMEYSEIKVLKSISDQITVTQFGRGCFINRKPRQVDVDMARSGLEEVRAAMLSEAYHVVILDEANIAVDCNLFPVSELVELVKDKPQGVELIITGRYASKELLDVADLVTEMKEVRHYYNRGIKARKGIER
ncbi:MAG: cob(I)yrinic acid a,c-diamide adenosyltransferase [Acidobacteria bacterium]|nr:MAG: cob(I)yrinic acid a,c-diamide adenosyltransferase [Acidobacteriota bacterium]